VFIPPRPIARPASSRIRQSLWMGTTRGENTRRIYGEFVSAIPKNGKTLVFLTNLTALPALTICDPYKSCWRVNLFFEWIKQYRSIKAFYGTSESAMKTQIWIAVSVYVLVAIIRRQSNLDVALYTSLRVSSMTVFEKTSIESVILQTADGSEYVTDDNRLSLFR